MRTLIVVDQGQGWYGGYEKIENGYDQKFCTDKNLIFNDIKRYTDMGYSIKCIGKDEKFDSGKPSMAEYFGL